MAKKVYEVRLTLEEREQLHRVIRWGKGTAWKLTRARILLKADQGRQGPAWTDQQVAEACEVCRTTVRNVRKGFAEGGWEAVLRRKPRCRPGTWPKLDGHKEAQLVALCCSPAPEGRNRWTLQLLADKLVELEVVDSISRETVRRRLKKTN